MKVEGSPSAVRVQDDKSREQIAVFLEIWKEWERWEKDRDGGIARVISFARDAYGIVSRLPHMEEEKRMQSQERVDEALKKIAKARQLLDRLEELIRNS